MKLGLWGQYKPCSAPQDLQECQFSAESYRRAFPMLLVRCPIILFIPRHKPDTLNPIFIYTVWIIMLSGFILSGFKCRDLLFLDLPCRHYGMEGILFWPEQNITVFFQRSRLEKFPCNKLFDHNCAYIFLCTIMKYIILTTNT
jgi:hypothetical protein